MRRSAVRVVVFLLFFSNIHFATAANSGELAQEFSKAQQLALTGEITQAVALYKSIISTNPQRPEAYNNLAALYLKQKKTEQAKQVLEQGLLAHKGYAALYKSLTAINVAMARDAYSKALQIDLKPSDISIATMALNKTLQNTKTLIKTESNKVVTQPRRVVNITKPANIQRVNTSTINNETIEKTLQAWSVAWSAQAVDMYLSFYHSQYKPSHGLSRRGWVQSRRLRLKKPEWIKVVLSDFEIKQRTEKQAVVNFSQSYQSNSFSDVSNKQIVLFYTDDGWRIFREKSL